MILPYSFVLNAVISITSDVNCKEEVGYDAIAQLCRSYFTHSINDSCNMSVTFGPGTDLL